MNKELEIGRCFACKKYFESNKLKQVTFLKPLGDGLIRKKELLCTGCNNQLETGIKNKGKKEETKNDR